MRNIDAETQYVEGRLSAKPNDKGDRTKLDADGVLRGKIGTMQANKLIGALDRYKTGHSVFD